MAWTADGRTALYAALHRLKGEASRGPWLIPAYCCPALVQTFIASRVEFDYYEVDVALTPRWDKLRERLESAPASGIIFVHYFGFRTDWSVLKATIRARNIAVIEDCAHMLMPESMAIENMESDAQIYSLRKWLPIPHGGALVLRSGDIVAQSLFAERTPSLFAHFFRAGALSLEGWVGFGLRGWLLSFPAFERYVERRDAMEHDYDRAMDPRVRSFLQAEVSKMDGIRRRQKMNYLTVAKLLSNLSGISFWHPVLANDECPFTLPLLIESGNRDRVLRRCLRLGVAARVYWKTLPTAVMTGDVFKASRQLAERILCLPIHHELGSLDLEKIYESVSSAVTGN